ncbi:MAG: histone deacetylase [Pikeienuella sp.]
MTLPIVFHKDYEIALRPGHAFPMSKYGYLRQALQACGLAPPGGFFAPVEAGAAVIGLAHDPGYVERVATGALGPEEAKRIGLPVGPALARRARLSSAGTLLAARFALERGIACNAAGGSHHADRDGGAGYCVFNDVAVAIAALLAEGAIRRAAVLDLDVHQGDGTARIFADDARVFTVSLHAERNFPARKARSDLDIALPDGTGDAAYLAALDAALERLEDQPADILFLNAGVDVLAGDRLGRLALSGAGLRAREKRALGRAAARRLPVVGVLGGGYGADLAEVAARHVLLFEEAAKLASVTA